MEEWNADVGTAGCYAMLIGQICRLAPEISPPSAYSNSPPTLALVLRYLRYNVYAPLFYLSLVKHRIEDDTDDETNTMATLARELAEYPFRHMSAAKLLEEIRKGLQLLQTGLRERESRLQEELESLERCCKSFWSAADWVLSAILVAINPAVLVAAMVAPMASITATLLASVAAAITAVSLLSLRDYVRKRRLESQKDVVKAMRRGCDSALLHDLEHIRYLLENHLRIARRNAATPTEDLRREVTARETARSVKKGMRKIVDRVERQVKKAAIDFVNIIAKDGVVRQVKKAVVDFANMIAECSSVSCTV